jgi:AcrR family transcriptional regulator
LQLAVALNAAIANDAPLPDMTTSRTSSSLGRSRKKKKPLVRGEPVVQRVLSMTLDLLADVGFAALRIDDVAVRAGVNKTTVYRRWPTKEALVRAALLTIPGEDIRAPETGSLRGDLVALGRRVADVASQPKYQTLTRMIVAEGPGSELGAIAQSLRESYEPLRQHVVGEAVARGEVANEREGRLIVEVFDAAIHFRFFILKIGIDGGYIEDVVDLLLGGRARRAPGDRPPLRRASRSRARPRSGA